MVSRSSRLPASPSVQMRGWHTNMDMPCVNPPVPLTRLLRMTLVVSPSAIGPHAYILDGSVIACIGGKLLSVGGSRREGAR